jgi:YesN/AraC family two-component response regulator
VWEQANRPIDLLMTDMVMPGGVMGSELAERLSNLSPRLKVIYTSGYSPGMAGKDISLLEGRNFLPKPYSIGKLAQFVRECLDTTAKPNELNGKPRELVTEVAGASREQTLGITQINSAVGQMDKVTQSSAAAAEESAAATEELIAQAETMKESVTGKSGTAASNGNGMGNGHIPAATATVANPRSAPAQSRRTGRRALEVTGALAPAT